ncbi:MAG: DNA cytosine methyltransferase [Clostridia bacterium]|nr:DNA cytosine methyltransferase [Clostridia bacterium]
MIRVIELFAGIGAQAAALDRIGAEWESVGIVEIDPYCVTAYNAIHGTNWEPSDITKIEKLPECDLLTYSFPCTDISTAGKQKGLGEGSGTRSSLLWEVYRLLTAYTDGGGTCRNTFSWKTSKLWSENGSSQTSTNGSTSSKSWATRPTGKFSTRRITAYRRTENACLRFRYCTTTRDTNSQTPYPSARNSKTCWNPKSTRNTT